MGPTNPVILNVSTPEYQRVIIDCSNGIRYYSDLSALNAVYCFPKNKIDWDKVSPDSYGIALIWTTRFEAHIDQIIALAYKTENLPKSA